MIRLALLLMASVAYGQVSVVFPSGFTGTSGVVSNTANGIRINDNTNSVLWFGDTWYCGWFPSTSSNHYCSYNDGWLISFTNFANVGIVQLNPYGGPNGGANGTALLNFMSSTMTAAYTDATLSGPVNCPGNPFPCSYKSRMTTTVAGHNYWNIFIDGGTTGIGHGTIIRNEDLDTAGAGLGHWCNSATVANGTSPCPINSTTLAGDAPNWVLGTTGVMFPASLGVVNNLGRWHILVPADYHDDGVHCPVIPTSMGGDGAGTYLYFYTDNAISLIGPHRVLCSDFPKLNASLYESRSGSSWVALTGAANVVANLCWCAGGSYGILSPFGTSPSFTVLTDINTIMMIAQGYQYTPISYAAAPQASVAYSIFGPYNQLPNTGFGTPQFQQGTNPYTFLLAANMNTVVTNVQSTIGYNAGWQPPYVPFPMTIGTETGMWVTAATNANVNFTVTRGPSPTSHSINDNILMPFRIEMALGWPIQGTWSCTTGVCGGVYMYTGAQSNATANDSTKTHGVYGAYIQQMTVRRSVAKESIAGYGDMPLKTASAKSRYSIPSKGLVMAYDFWQHNGNTIYGTIADPQSGVTKLSNLWPTDLMNPGQYCTVGHDVGAQPTVVTWTTEGLQILGTNGEHPTCLTSDNFPVTGNNTRTVVMLLKLNTLAGDPVIWSLHGKGAAGAGHNMNMNVAASGGLYSCVNTGCNFSAASVPGVAANTWMVYGVTYDGGTMGSGYTLWMNGNIVCGSRGTACPTNGGSLVLATDAAQIDLGNYDFGTNWSGTLGGFYVWNRGLSTDDMKEIQIAFRNMYRNRFVVP